MSEDYIALPDTAAAGLPRPHEFEAGFTGRTCERLYVDAHGDGDVCGRGPLDRVHATTPLPTEAMTWVGRADAPTQPVRLSQRTPATLADVSEVRHEAMSAYVDHGAALDAFRREAGLWLAGIAVCLAALGGGLIAMVVLYAQQATP
jgi:hypothetical protein